MFTAGFMNLSSVSSKCGCYLDPRQCLTQTRSNAVTYGENSFENLTGWTTSPGGVSVVDSGSADSAIGSTLNLSTGATKGTPAFVQRKYSAIPANFGFAIFPALVDVGADISDALLVQIQKTVNQKNLQMRFFDGGLYVFINGTWTQLSTHSNKWYCEWWIEVAEVGGVDVVTAYAGTEYMNSISGALPNGPSGNGGLVYIGQESTSTANRNSRVAYIAIGATQLCDDMAVTWDPYTLVVPATSVTIAAFIEEVAAITPNTDLTLELSINGGAFSPVTLEDAGTLCYGTIDHTKPITMFKGTLTGAFAIGSTVTARIKTFNNKFIGLHGVNICPTSTL